MLIAKLAVCALLVFSSLTNVYNIDEPREPITRGVAIASLIITALAVWVILL